ncbi:MAG TPA: peptidase P60 [Clostridiales bacterium]|nr:peptidase P60 [Clostridiales bacterium]
MKIKVKLIAALTGFLAFFSLLVFVAIFISDEPSNSLDSDFKGNIHISVSADTLKYRNLVEKYAKKHDISEYVAVLLAIIEVESGGKLPDVMQSSESKGLPPNTIDNPEDSIQQGVSYFARLIKSAKSRDVDDASVIQAYNFGGGFLSYVSQRGKSYRFELAENFSKERANGRKVTYRNPIAIKKNGGWRYAYGNMFYYDLVNQYLTAASAEFDDETVQTIMNEALKYEGYPYVFGGSNPNTSFDCSGLTQWSYGKAGIHLPRTAQQQYDATQSIPLSEAKPGDLVFFHSTYNAGTYVTHVAIYVGNNRIYHAGDVRSDRTEVEVDERRTEKGTTL